MIGDRWERNYFVPNGAKFRLGCTIDFKAQNHVQMILLDHGLDVLWQFADEVFDNTAHLGLECDLLKLTLQLLVLHLFIDFWSL